MNARQRAQHKRRLLRIRAELAAKEDGMVNYHGVITPPEKAHETSRLNMQYSPDTAPHEKKSYWDCGVTSDIAVRPCFPHRRLLRLPRPAVHHGPPRDSVGRSLLKTAIYRAVSSLDTIAFAYLFMGPLAHWFGGPVQAALAFGLVDQVWNTAFYYLFERAWAHLDLKWNGTATKGGT